MTHDDLFINRTRLETELNKDYTRVMTVGFTKVTGEYRIMTFKTATKDNPYNVKMDNGYVTVFDMIASEFRTINMEQIDYLTVDNKLYWIK